METAEQSVEELPRAKGSSVAISVIVAVTERHGDLGEVYRAHAEVLRQSGYSFEFLFVLDGGFEGAAQALEPFRAAGEPVRVLTLPREFGEATVLMVGFAQAQGEILITLPAYFQVVPEGVVEVLKKVEEGYDLVITRRFPRIDSWINQIQTRGFHFLIHRLTGVQLHDTNCGLRGIRRRVVSDVHLYGDLQRFLPLLAYQRGFRVIEVEVPQHPTEGHIRVYHPGLYLRRLLDVLMLTFLFKFTRKPLRFFGLIGAGLFGVGFLVSLVLAVQKILGTTDLADRPLLILGVLLMVLGVEIGSIGLLGEMIIFTHARKMKEYAIDKVLR